MPQAHQFQGLLQRIQCGLLCVQLVAGADGGEPSARDLGHDAHAYALRLGFGRLQAGAGAFQRPPLGPEQVGLPGRVEARVVDGLRGVKAGDRTYGQGSVLALTAPVDARASGGGGQCLAGHTIAQGACLIDACRSVAQIQVLCQRRGHQAIEDGIVQCRPPLAQVCGLGFACQRQAPAAADVDRRRLAVVGAHACAGSQQHAGQGQHERTRAPRGQAGDGCAKKGSAGLGFHCRRPRTNTVAMVSVARAMTASGHRLARMSPGGMALRKLPSTMMRKWVSGMA